MSQIGLDQGLWYRSDGDIGDALSAATFASDFTLINIVKDLTFNKTRGEADLSSRVADVRLRKATLKDWSLSFNINKNPSNALCELLIAAAEADTIYEYVLTDGNAAPSASDKVYRFAGMIFDNTQNEPLEDGVTIDFVIYPTYDSVLVPSRATMPS